MAGTRPPDKLTTRTSRILKHTAFVAMLACAICILFLGLTSKSDNPAFRSIVGAPLPTIQYFLLGVWAFFAFMYTGITIHYAKTHPFWPLVAMMLIMLMTSFFTTHLGFDIMDWPTWGPLAAVLGIIIKAGIHHTYNSADRSLMGQLRDCLMGIEHNENEDNGPNGANGSQEGHELGYMSNRRAGDP